MCSLHASLEKRSVANCCHWVVCNNMNRSINKRLPKVVIQRRRFSCHNPWGVLAGVHTLDLNKATRLIPIDPAIWFFGTQYAREQRKTDDFTFSQEESEKLVVRAHTCRLRWIPIQVGPAMMLMVLEGEVEVRESSKDSPVLSRNPKGTLVGTDVFLECQHVRKCVWRNSAFAGKSGAKLAVINHEVLAKMTERYPVDSARVSDSQRPQILSGDAPTECVRALGYHTQPPIGHVESLKDRFFHNDSLMPVQPETLVLGSNQASQLGQSPLIAISNECSSATRAAGCTDHTEHNHKKVATVSLNRIKYNRCNTKGADGASVVLCWPTVSWCDGGSGCRMTLC